MKEMLCETAQSALRRSLPGRVANLTADQYDIAVGGCNFEKRMRDPGRSSCVEIRLKPSRKRALADQWTSRFGASSRQACDVLKLSRSVYHHQSVAQDQTLLIVRIKEIRKCVLWLLRFAPSLTPNASLFLFNKPMTQDTSRNKTLRPFTGCDGRNVGL
jgi:galactokinase/mevalonate kinase-like predicted kinase